ncbi:MAG: DNA mismatch repair endonuclease MutL [Proteobacteria bacterium]|jgi:DNA mismatch repair protein MutL|nr:DNA mismatch repair endonuclease MutL [Pseudomonadota bacterium]
MTVIRRLPDHVINQIKAGEVVERPVSVVKELLENALDAGADDIVIELIDGGRQLIRISDNGCGMSAEDALLALERHATSKISQTDDLLELATFGFRGEALPSIAAVSDFSLKTRRNEDGTGTEIRVRGGECSGPLVCAMPAGTEICVRDLFEAIPARRKFLRSTATEFAHIHELLQAMALAYHKVGFRLNHNGREVFGVPSCATLMERFKAVLGSEASEYIQVSFEKGSFRLEGFVQKPDAARPVPRYFMTFVNGRMVKDRIVRNGVLSGYTGLVMKGLVPACVLFVSVDPHILDVNAHPNKTEIRFTDPALVQDLVTLALQSDLRRSTQNQMLSTLPTAETIVRVPAEMRRGEWSPFEMKQDNIGSRPLRQESFQNTVPRQETAGSALPRMQTRPASAAAPAQFTPQMFSDRAVTDESSADDNPLLNRNPDSVPHENSLRDAVYLGQFKNCYLLFQSADDLLVVDQHAYHERILFEELAVRIEGEQGLARQALLAPMMIPVPPSAAEVIREEEEHLRKLGFEIEVLNSGRSVALHSLPTQVDVSHAAELFDDVVARILAVRGFQQTDAHPLIRRAHRLGQEWLDAGIRPANLSRREVFHLHLATLACHSAVRSGDPLDAELVRRLLVRGEAVDFFAHCPHGRPVWRRWTAQDVAQWFSRI